MILYSGPLSLYSRKVEIALGEKGLACEIVYVPFTQKMGYAPKHKAVVAANPKGQVPVFIDGDLTLYDSTVIVEYLDEAYPRPPLYPDDARQRARVRLLELEADEVMLQAVRPLMFRTEPPEADAGRRTKQEEQARLAYPMIAANHARIDSRLAESGFLAGDFSAADIATFMMVHWALRLAGPSVANLANLRRWYKSLAARPAFSKAVREIEAADREISYPVQGAFTGL
jgi:glutathione S-transferase